MRRTVAQPRSAGSPASPSVRSRSDKQGFALHPPDYGIGAGDGGAAALAPRSQGSPLPSSLEARMGASFGADFSGVRVHADHEAAGLAASIDARAFSRDGALVFGAGQYAPENPAGRWLIAHELAHVVQQRQSSPGVQRFGGTGQGDAPAEHEADAAADTAVGGGRVGPLAAAPAGKVLRFSYETRGVSQNRANVTALTGANYWLQRTGDAYDVTISQRMGSDPEEHDAVLAALWALGPPTTVTARVVRLVPIAARPVPPPPVAAPGAAPPPTPVPAPTAPPPLLYRLIFEPPAAPKGKPRVTAEFVGSGAGAIPQVAPVPTAGAGNGGFPSGIEPALDAHPGELAKLQSWLAAAPPAVDQFLTLTTTNRTGTVTHRTLVHVVRTTGSNGGLSVDVVSEGAVEAVQTVPADYRTRDAADYELEKLRRTSRKAADRLGTVTLPAGIPANEAIPVKLAISGYFSNASWPARNTEVDAIIPIGSGTATALYSLTFGANNNVTVTRIGLAGTAKGEVNTARLDVTRVSGFPGAAAGDAALRAWWTARYPSGGTLTTAVPAATPAPPPGTAPGAANPAPNAALIAEMNTLLAAGPVNAAWFSGNYGITVVDAATLATRLQSLHSVPAALTSDTVGFSADDFATLELSLQTLTASEITNLKGTRIGRKTASFRSSGASFVAGAATQYGLTLTKGSGATLERTVVYFDSIRQSNDTLFRGSTAANALPDVAMNMLHELGHAGGPAAGAETAFNAWRAVAKPASPTWYAAGDPAHELFPEAFGLFHTDPHFLCTSAPALYAWFHVLATTGTPPAAGATLPTPACPP